MGKNTTDEEQRVIVRFLCDHCVNGKLSAGSIAKAVEKFGRHRNTISLVWNRRDNPGSRMAGRVGRKPKYDPAVVTQALQAAPQRLRRTVRAAAAQVGMPKSSFAVLVKSGDVTSASTRIKPLLCEDTKKKRLEFILQFIHQEPSLMFHDFYDCVHIDEKWFFIDMDRKRVYLAPGEKIDQRMARSKRYLTKVMVMVAVARPRYDSTRNQWFDGKIGLWPFVETRAAKRASKNRPAGTLETVTVNIDCERSRDMLVNSVIPAIKRVWPGRSKPIFIQQDNAGPHCLKEDAAVKAAGTSGGWNIRVRPQPANSPDFNVLDLGFFNSIQALQQTMKMSNIDELIAAVAKSFNELDRVKLDNIFLTLMGVMEQCLLDRGGNHYSIPHIKKEQRRRNGDPLRSLQCSMAAVEAGYSTCYAEALSLQ